MTEDRLLHLDNRVDALESKLSGIDSTLKTLKHIGLAVVAVISPTGIESIRHLAAPAPAPQPQIIYQQPAPLPPPPSTPIDPNLPPEYRR